MDLSYDAKMKEKYQKKKEALKKKNKKLKNKEEVLNEREKNISKRETIISFQEKGFNDKEEVLNEREKNITERETILSMQYNHQRSGNQHNIASPTKDTTSLAFDLQNFLNDHILKVDGTIQIGTNEIDTNMSKEELQDILSQSKYSTSNFDEDDSFKNCLTTSSETVMQSNVMKYLNNQFGNQVMDTSKSAKDTPYCGSIAKNSIHTSDDKPDITFTEYPIVMELKTSCSKSSNLNNKDYELLLQCFTKGVSMITRMGYLNRAYIFGCSNNRCWLLRCSNFTDDEPNFNFHLNQISPNNVISKLKKLLKKDTMHFFRDDASILSNVTSNIYPSLNLPLEYFCVKMIATSSTCTVYGIFPPESKEKSQNIFWQRGGDKAIAVKIVERFCDSYFKTEIECMKDIVKYYDDENLGDFYALGYLQYDNGEHIFNYFSDNMHKQFLQELNTDFINPRTKWKFPDSQAQAIVMHLGSPVDYHNLTKDDKSDIRTKLHHIHNAGWFHRDIRYPNIINFGSKLGIHIIDFGFSCKNVLNQTSFNIIPDAIAEILLEIGVISSDRGPSPEWNATMDLVFLMRLIGYVNQ